MKGRLLDAGLLVVWLATFLIVGMVHPGIANLLIAWFGAIALGWYNTLIRLDSKTDALRGPWQPKPATASTAQDT
jgi:hypothetical protein